MRKYSPYAPYGVTLIQTGNRDAAVFLHGEMIICTSAGVNADTVMSTGKQIAAVNGVPFGILSFPISAKEWSWNGIVHSLGWGEPVNLTRMQVRHVMECCISHITLEDNFLLNDLCQTCDVNEWIHDTGVGYLLRLDACTKMLIRLKKLGLSRTTRLLIYCGMKYADISMIHFSSVGDELEGFVSFTW